MAYRYRIIKQIGTLSKSDNGQFTTEVNLISHNDSMPKLDIRHWDHRGEEPKMLKGIALTREETEMLFDYMNKDHLSNTLFEVK